MMFQVFVVNINSSLGRCGRNFRRVAFKQMLHVKIISTSLWNCSLINAPQNTFAGGRSTLVQVMGCTVRQQAITWANVDLVLYQLWWKRQWNGFLVDNSNPRQRIELTMVYIAFYRCQDHKSFLRRFLVHIFISFYKKDICTNWDHVNQSDTVKIDIISQILSIEKSMSWIRIKINR